MAATLDDPLPRRGYHIGNVRSGLLDHALLILESEGLEHLNLRGPATRSARSTTTSVVSRRCLLNFPPTAFGNSVQSCARSAPPSRGYVVAR